MPINAEKMQQQYRRAAQRKKYNEDYTKEQLIDEIYKVKDEERKKASKKLSQLKSKLLKRLDKTEKELDETWEEASLFKKRIDKLSDDKITIYKFTNKLLTTIMIVVPVVWFISPVFDSTILYSEITESSMGGLMVLFLIFMYICHAVYDAYFPRD